MRSTREIIEASVIEYFSKYRIEKSSRIIAAFSGGPDSTVLLSVLSGLEGFDLNITAAYYNHGLREHAELLAEEEHVCRQAAALGIRCEIGRSKPGLLKKEAASTGLSLEEAARNARYFFLRELCVKLKADYIAVGHNQNDNTETMLMRFLQNAGVAGLSGIPEKRDEIIRPLCRTGRNQIERYLEEERIVCSIDKTNLENNFLRNRVRNELLPAVKEVFPDVDSNLAAMAGKMRLYNDFIRAESGKRLKWEATKTGWKIKNDVFYREDKLLRVKSLFSTLNLVSSAARINYKSVLKAATAGPCENGKILLRISDAEVFTGDDFIFIDRLVNRDKKSYLLHLEPGVSVNICGQNIKIIDADMRDDTEEACSEVEICLIEIERPPVIIRSYREGDCVDTDAGTKSVKKLFNEWKVRSEDKCRIPVVEDSSRIRAVVGKHLGYNNKTAASGSEPCGDLKKILLFASSDTETTGE